MWRVFWLSGTILASIVAFLIWVACNATFLFQHPKTAGYRVEVRHAGGAVVVGPINATSSMTVEAHSVAKLPKAVALESDYDFGIMDPLTMGRHDFMVTNRGEAPLKLEVGPTTCKCTLSGLSRNEVGPGETATVTLEWNTGRDPVYSHAGTIRTNDPSKKWLEFRIRGSVRLLVGADNPEITIERIEPNEATIVDRLVYSQIWEHVNVTKVNSTIAGLSWQVDHVDPASVPHLDAKAVARLRIEIPGDLPSGELTDTLRVCLQSPDDTSQEHHIDLPIQAKVLKRIGFYGAAINEVGIIDLGTILEGQGAKAQVLVKVRESDCDLSNARIQISPAFLTAEIHPHVTGQNRGLYTLVVKLDPNAPVCAYRSGNLGQLRLDTKNERLGSVDLGVSFVVMQRQPL